MLLRSAGDTSGRLAIGDVLTILNCVAATSSVLPSSSWSLTIDPFFETVATLWN